METESLFRLHNAAVELVTGTDRYVDMSSDGAC